MGVGKLAASLLTTAIVFGADFVRADDVQTIYERELSSAVAGSSSSASKVKTYLSTLQANGTWSAVNYATGCDAQRASWPAGDHWKRIIAMTAAYHGGVQGADQYIKSAELKAAIDKAMDYWFANDFSTVGNGACMDGGGIEGDMCPCGTPGLWNTNWYSNVILVPTFVGKACVLLRDELSASQYGNCTLMTARAYTPFYRNPQPDYVSGANIIDMSVVGILAGILENNKAGNASRIADAYQRVHDQVTVQSNDKVDGIKPDGSFQQHTGIIYDGNYGKDFSNSLLELELLAMGTQFQASKAVQDTFGLHLGGAQWMTFANTLSKVVHWDFSVIGRMITFPVAHDQASANLKMDLEQVSALGKAWNQKDLIQFGGALADPNPTTANAGHLNGNRMFWNSDYMVHRTDQTVTTLKMLSTRTATSECVNSQNPFGFHLGDGTLYTYTTGAEYEDMYATFDFNLVPGTTVDYGATPLMCSTTQQFGVDSYAGGVSAGDAGMAAMRYVNPLTRSLSFHKAWIFFPDNVQHVLVNSVKSTTPAPVFSVLDQRLRSGDIVLDGERVASGNYSDIESLWHAGTGYVFPFDQHSSISIDASNRTGDWKSIGTSTEPPPTKDMFAAWVEHGVQNKVASDLVYSIFPAMETPEAFEEKADRCTPYTVSNTDVVSAAVDTPKRVLGAAFWEPEGGLLFVPQMMITVTVDAPVVIMVRLADSGLAGQITVADPTHERPEVNIRIARSATGHRRGEGCIGHHCPPVRRGINPESRLNIKLPSGGLAGSGVTRQFKF